MIFVADPVGEANIEYAPGTSIDQCLQAGYNELYRESITVNQLIERASNWQNNRQYQALIISTQATAKHTISTHESTNQTKE